ncbi:DUF4145 domain-containing protein [Rothia nasimurium]|uniref:DUF4145 domain-containing protein n=1 Tax=Rothia nasimurium TaxID=85336 RepID=UPI0016236779|nr:DUF4145 domain-containing protein [Rothia nasimurium]
MTKDRSPRYSAESFVCPNCGAFAGQNFEDLYLIENGKFYLDQMPPFLTIEYPYHAGNHFYTGEPVPPTAGDIWHVSICHSCKKSSFWEGYKLVYPLPQSAGFPEPSEDMPPKVAELYKEASAVFPISKRASAALMRAATEQLVYELTKEALPKVNLNGRINYLSQSVPKHIFQALTTIRVIGNKVLHSGDEEALAVTIFLNEDSEGIPGVLANSLNALVNEFITNRNLVDEMYENLPESIRNGVADVMAKYHENNLSNPEPMQESK